MVERYIDFLGLEEIIELLKANERPLTPSIRVNTLKIEVKTIKKRLENKGFALEPIKWVEYGFNISKFPFNLGALHEHIQGYYYIQSVATMLPALILNPHTNDVVIDMCAAPGGKATHLTQIMNNQGKLILLERKSGKSLCAFFIVSLSTLVCVVLLTINHHPLNLYLFLPVFSNSLLNPSLFLLQLLLS